MNWAIETTDETFERDVIERSKEVPVVVDFSAKWCRPCCLLGPILEKLAADFSGKFVLVKANFDRTRTAAARFGIQSIPTVYGFRDGELRDAFAGLLKENQIKLWLRRFLATEAETIAAGADKIADTDPEGTEQK